MRIFLFDTSFPYGEWYTQSPTDNSVLLTKQMSDSDIFSKLVDILWVQYYATSQNPALYYIKIVVNYFLWILAFIALVVLIYGFYSILFDWKKSEESLQIWRKYVKASIISIVWIWLSWLIVSFIFYVVSKWF